MRSVFVLPAVAIALTNFAALAQSPVAPNRDAAHEERIRDQQQAVKAHEARLAQQDRVQDQREEERARRLAAFHTQEKQRLAYEAHHNMGHHDRDRDHDGDRDHDHDRDPK